MLGGDQHRNRRRRPAPINRQPRPHRFAPINTVTGPEAACTVLEPPAAPPAHARTRAPPWVDGIAPNAPGSDRKPFGERMELAAVFDELNRVTGPL